jgi:UDP-N-acetylmuramoyl-L-alanine---L-glutamate ligase
MYADPALFMASLSSFKPLPHRLQTVGVVNGVTFINDSISTTPESTIAALNSLQNKVGTLIAGGLERHQDYHSLAKAIAASAISHCILFPDTGERLASLLPPHITRFNTSSMAKAVSFAIQNTPSGKICLLSPAAPSYNLFASFEDRGHQFMKAIHAHQKPTP